MIFQIITFLLSIFVLTWLSSSLIKTLIEIAKYLRWQEFIIAFFVMGFVSSLPNLFVDLPAALQGLATLSFGDIIGGNLVDLTLVTAIIMFFSNKKAVSADSRMVQGSAIFTFLIAVLPVFLIWNGKVTRLDGIILILVFFVYVFWLFSKDDRYKKVYRQTKKEAISPAKAFTAFLKNLLKLILLIIILLLVAQAVIFSARYFSKSLGISLSLVGVLIVALGNSFPETYFGIMSSRKDQGWMVIGGIMGSVITTATLVLGIIALISPFEIKDMTPFFIARIFTIIAAVIFLIIFRTGKNLTKKEGLLLFFIYVAFLSTEILTEIFIKR